MQAEKKTGSATTDPTTLLEGLDQAAHIIRHHTEIMARMFFSSHGRYMDEDGEDRALYSHDPAIIGGPPSRHRHSTSFTEAGVGGKSLRVAMVLLVVGFNGFLFWGLGWWGGLWRPAWRFDVRNHRKHCSGDRLGQSLLL